MPVAIPRTFVEYVLLGPTGDRRQLQDSPILGDVWIAFADKPNEAQELLITPHRSQTATSVAVKLDELIAADRRALGGKRAARGANIAPLHGIIAARLYFDEILRFVVPRTEWWTLPRIGTELRRYLQQDGLEKLQTVFETLKGMSAEWSTANVAAPRVKPFQSAFDRYIALTGLILWASDQETTARGDGSDAEKALAATIADASSFMDDRLAAFFTSNAARMTSAEPALVHQVSLNRKAMLATSRSVPAIKADAARGLFNVRCKDIAWAVLDSGIQADHPAFRLDDESRKKRKDRKSSRVEKSFDFRNFRKIMSLDNGRIFSDDGDKEEQQAILDTLRHENLKERPEPDEAVKILRELAEDMKMNRPINWEQVEKFIEIKGETPCESDHGTHVAGIIGGRAVAHPQGDNPEQDEDAGGVCPDIRLYDFRVMSDSLENTEFAIIAALQFIQFMNVRRQSFVIHGANLSLSIRHDVRNYACGKTPVCMECERLVNSGVVVVAAAGNFGYQTFTTKDGAYEGYAAFSITDPGNADGVITVGSTHRDSPHTYGVSFFSSRGPTGDGRLKPDLVAPGERIHAPFSGNSWGDLDGTSMAAPHVSGAAAMLLARYSEMIGEPRRIKQILCDSATDLGRERSFQGHGMLDVLRAFQSI